MCAASARKFKHLYCGRQLKMCLYNSTQKTGCVLRWLAVCSGGAPSVLLEFFSVLLCVCSFLPAFNRFQLQKRPLPIIRRRLNTNNATKRCSILCIHIRMTQYKTSYKILLYSISYNVRLALRTPSSTRQDPRHGR